MFFSLTALVDVHVLNVHICMRNQYMAMGLASIEKKIHRAQYSTQGADMRHAYICYTQSKTFLGQIINVAI